jgi:hypothetical protein
MTDCMFERLKINPTDVNDTCGQKWEGVKIKLINVTKFDVKWYMLSS